MKFMAEKTYITSANTAIFVCAACNRQHVVDVAKHLERPRQNKLKVTCTCGHSWTSILEKRRYFRKSVNFPGTYTKRVAGKPVGEGHMYVQDISRRGLKIKLRDPGKFEIGDWIEVEFRLDNRPRTLIKRVTAVKNIFGPYLGLAFPDHKHEDPDLGFYLMTATPDADEGKKGTGDKKKGN